MGGKMTCVELENDFEDRLWPGIRPFEKRLADATPDEIISIIKNAGIAGMGGATFPTYAKIQSAIGKVNHLIINSAECEPFIHRQSPAAARIAGVGYKRSQDTAEGAVAAPGADRGRGQQARRGVQA